MRRLSLRSLCLIGLLLLFTAGAARAEDPAYVGWSALLPGLTTEFDPSSENDCTAGRTRCVDAVIREMRRRFDPLARSCDHDSIFALAYLRTTEEYRRTIEDPTFDATAGATNPLAQVRPIHRPPRVPAGRTPHCAWRVDVVASGDDVLPTELEGVVAMSAAAQLPLPTYAGSGPGRQPGGQVHGVPLDGVGPAGGRAQVAGEHPAVRDPGADRDHAGTADDEPDRGDQVVDVVAGLAAAGRPAIVVPLLLSGGYHVHVDIAGAVADAEGAVAARPLGPDPRLAEVLHDRLVEAGGDPREPLTAVVLAAAGSSDPRSVADVENTADLLQRTWAGPVTTGYGSAASPTVRDAVLTARRGGAARVVVASYLLAPGHFHDKLGGAGADAVTAPLLPDDRIAAVLLDRYDAALTATG